MVKLKTFLAVAFASALMLTVMAAPAFAFHHTFLPGGACGQNENAGGQQPHSDERDKDPQPGAGADAAVAADGHAGRRTLRSDHGPSRDGGVPGASAVGSRAPRSY